MMNVIFVLYLVMIMMVLFVFMIHRNVRLHWMMAMIMCILQSMEVMIMEMAAYIECSEH